MIQYKKFFASPWKRLIPLFLLVFLDSVGYFLIIPVLLRIFINTHSDLVPTNTSATQRDILYGIAMMLSPLALLLASPFAGHLSDRFGRKRTMVYCLVTGLLGYLLPIIGIVKHSLSLIFIGRFIAGGSTCSQPVAQAAITDFTSGRKKAFYLSLIAFAMTLAMVLGPIIGGYTSDDRLVSWFNITTPYFISIALSLLNIFLILIFYFDDQQAIRTNKDRLIKVILKPNIWRLLAIYMFMELGWSQYYQAIYLFLDKQYHFSADQISLFTGYIGIVISLGLTIIYKILTRYFKIKPILFGSFLTATVGLLLCCYTRNESFQWVAVTAASLGIAIAYPSILSLLSDATSNQHQGLVMGVASTALGFTWMITGFFAGYLISILLPLPIYVAAGFNVIGFILLIEYLRGRHESAC